jgi:5-formyltetrahydrofolate cyclo-ligase
MNKPALREFYLNERKNLSQNEYEKRCQAVSNRAIEFIEKSQSSYVHLFLPIKNNKEVATWPVYHWLLNSKKHTPVISKTHVKQKYLSHHPMTAEDELLVSNYGIPEPRHDRMVKADRLDLVFVPLLAFDCSGHRVGYGAGFYDRFLAQCRPDTLKIGLSITQPTLTAIDTNSFDIALDYCINHQELYDFSA